MEHEKNTTRPRYPIGRETAKAWLLTVINPSIRALKAELKYLDRGDLTWLAHLGDFEVVGKFQESIKLEYFPNYDHFLFLSEEALTRVSQYMEQAASLRDASRNLQDILERSPELASVYEATSSESSLKVLNVDNVEELFGGYSKERQLRYFAQLIVNNRGELDIYYTAYKFWNAYRDRFLDIRTAPAIKPVSQQQTDARLGMRQSVAGLIDFLTEARNQIVEDFDVPPAPLESTL